MKKIAYIMCALALVFSACRKRTGASKEKEEREVSEAIEKDMNGYAIRVNRQYDKEGRLVVYDSTYASHYIDRPMDSAWMDSVFFAFEEEFACTRATRDQA